MEILTRDASGLITPVNQTNPLFVDTREGFAIARGAVTNFTSGNKAGRNTDVDIGTEDIISQGGIYVPPTVARIHNIVSSSVQDGVAGTGALTITINGLDAAYAEVNETITMNGTTIVPTVYSYIFINRMSVATAGSTATNVGTITSTAQTDATVSAQITAGDGQAALGVYQVPLGKTTYLFDFNASVRLASGAAGTAILQLMTRTFGGAWTKRQTIMVNATGGSFVERAYKSPLVLAAKTMVKIQVTSDTNNMDVACAFDYINIAT